MSRRLAIVVIGAALALAAILGGWWWLAQRGGGPGGPGPEEDAGAAGSERAVLYFPADDGWLYAEEREIAATGSPRERVRLLVEALLAGPETLGLSSPYPEGVGLIEVYTSPDGTAFVDLGSEELADPPAGGSRAEMMMVYSVVDTVVQGVPEVERVALLWNGAQRESFTGHLDTSRALAPEMDLVARGEHGDPSTDADGADGADDADDEEGDDGGGP